MLIDVNRAVLLVVDVQEKLVPAIHDPQNLVQSLQKLIAASHSVGMPIVFTEQYPKGIGGTLPILREAAPDAPVVDKMHFSCVAANCLPEMVAKREQVILCGMEAHVCVMQTALELRARGQEVFVVTDAIASRSTHDYATALRRYEQAGVHLVTREMVLFESLRISGTETFRHASKTWLVEAPAPLSRHADMSIHSRDLVGKNFAEILAMIEDICPAPDVLELANADGHFIYLENVPGQSGSIKLYNYLLEAYGTIDAEAARAGLKLYAEHTMDAISHPGKHPNIDRLLQLAAGHLSHFAPLHPHEHEH